MSYKYRKAEFNWEGLGLPRHTDKGSDTPDVWATIAFPTRQGQHLGDGGFYRRVEVPIDVRDDD